MAGTDLEAEIAVGKKRQQNARLAVSVDQLGPAFADGAGLVGYPPQSRRRVRALERYEERAAAFPDQKRHHQRCAWSSSRETQSCGHRRVGRKPKGLQHRTGRLRRGDHLAPAIVAVGGPRSRPAQPGGRRDRCHSCRRPNASSRNRRKARLGI